MAELISEENIVKDSENKNKFEKNGRIEGNNNDFPNLMKPIHSQKLSHTNTEKMQNSVEQSINHVHIKNDAKSKKESSSSKSTPSKESRHSDKHGEFNSLTATYYAFFTIHSSVINICKSKA